MLVKKLLQKYVLLYLF